VVSGETVFTSSAQRWANLITLGPRGPDVGPISLRWRFDSGVVVKTLQRPSYVAPNVGPPRCRGGSTYCRFGADEQTTSA
jgi:hypothetical protein